VDIFLVYDAPIIGNQTTMLSIGRSQLAAAGAGSFIVFAGGINETGEQDGTGHLDFISVLLPYRISRRHIPRWKRKAFDSEVVTSTVGLGGRGAARPHFLRGRVNSQQLL
jgi:hypothetical protein